MGPIDRLRPRRSLVLPFLVLAFPALYAVRADLCPLASGALGTCAALFPLRYAGYALGAVAAAYLAAVTLVTALSVDDRDLGRYGRLAFRPTDRTLVLVTVAVAGLAAYAAATLAADLPRSVDLLLAPAGLLLGLPLVVTVTGLAAVHNAFPPGLPSAVESVAVAVSLGLVGAWTLLLASALDALLERAGFGRG